MRIAVTMARGQLAVRNPARWAPGGYVTGSDLDVIKTARLLVRPAQEADRDRFVELFGNEDFMVYFPGGALTQDAARRRFDHMVAVCQTVPFGKQPVIELSSGAVV